MDVFELIETKIQLRKAISILDRLSSGGFGENTVDNINLTLKDKLKKLNNISADEINTIK